MALKTNEMKDFKDFLTVLFHVLIGTALLYLTCNGFIVAILAFALWTASTLLIKSTYNAH